MDAHFSDETIAQIAGAENRPRQSGFLILLACAIFVPLTFFAVGASSAWNATEEETVLSLERVTNMLHEQALRSFETHEALIAATEQRIWGLDWNNIRDSASQITAFISALPKSAPPVAAILIADPQDRIVAASQNLGELPPEFSDPKFMEQLRGETSRISISTSLQKADGRRAFALARQRQEAPGTAGLVVSLFDASFFEIFYDSLRRERSDVIALLREDGAILARSALDPDVFLPGATHDAREILKRADYLNASLRVSDAERQDMLYIVRRVGEHPVFLIHGRSVAGLPSQWLVRILPYALLCLTSISFMLLLTLRTWQASKREQQAHAQLAVEAANLASKTEANLRMTRMMDANVFGVVTFSVNGIISANDAFLRMVGVGRRQFERNGFIWRNVKGIDIGCDLALLDELRETGTCAPFETEILITDHHTVPVLVGVTLYDRDPFTWTCFVLDLTERREREAQQIFVMRELNHRTKNLLTVIRSIAGQIARTGSGWDDFRDRFNSRLAALASAHDLLVDSNWNGASLAHLIQSQFSQFHDLAAGQIVTSGTDINLSPRAAQAIGMGLYELMTNAVKYGALSTPSGRIEVFWAIRHQHEEEPIFHMHWRERGGPPVLSPPHRGFGHIVIAEMTARSLRGEVNYAFEPEGVSWHLKAPLEAVEENYDAADRPTNESRAA